MIGATGKKGVIFTGDSNGVDGHSTWWGLGPWRFSGREARARQVQSVCDTESQTVQEPRSVKFVSSYPALLMACAIQVFAAPAANEGHDDPWSKVPKRPPHTDHSGFFDKAFRDGPSVTRA